MWIFLLKNGLKNSSSSYFLLLSYFFQAPHTVIFAKTSLHSDIFQSKSNITNTLKLDTLEVLSSRNNSNIEMVTIL